MHPLLELLIDRIPEGVTILKEMGLNDEQAAMNISVTILNEFHAGIKMLEDTGEYKGDTKKECETFVRKLNNKIRDEIEIQYGGVPDSYIDPQALNHRKRGREQKDKAMSDLLYSALVGEGSEKVAQIRDDHLIQETESFIQFCKDNLDLTAKECLKETKDYLLGTVMSVKEVKQMRGQFFEEDQRDGEQISKKLIATARKKIEEVYGVKFKKRGKRK